MEYVELVKKLREQAQMIDDDCVYGQGGDPDTNRAAADAIEALTASSERSLLDIITRSWCDGYRAAKDPDRTNVIPDWLKEAEDDFGDRSAAYALRAIDYYKYKGELTVENVLDELPRPTPPPPDRLHA